MHRFHELEVYKKAIKFTRTARDVTKSFPRQELFMLTSQFVRAADSIALNIAEGAGNTSSRESLPSSSDILFALDMSALHAPILHLSKTIFLKRFISMFSSKSAQSLRCWSACRKV